MKPFIFLVFLVSLWGAFVTVALSQSSENLSPQESATVKDHFQKVDDFMNDDNYDSAQYWLNRVDLLLTIKKPTYFTYLFHSRQCEIYYFNNLVEIGIKEANKGLAVAKLLNDRSLLADSFNFLGLFYINSEQLKNAEASLLKALSYTLEDNDQGKADYYNLTQKYHIYGNLAEVYINQRQYGKAITAIDSSMKLALQKGKVRPYALGQFTKAELLLKQGNAKEAMQYYEQAQRTCKQAKDFTNLRDVYLVTFSGIAKCQLRLNQLQKELISQGLEFYHNQKDINRYYSLLFINDAIQIFKQTKDYKLLAECLEIKSDIENQNVKGSLKKLETTVNVSLRNEKKVLEMELQKVKAYQENERNREQNLTIILGLVAVIVGILIWTNQKLVAKNRELVQKNQAISAALLQGQTTERKRIAADLHDNLGGTMSALNWSLEAIDIKKLSPQEQDVYEHVKRTIANAHEQVRLLSHNLLPDEFEKQGLIEALRYLIRKINQNKTTHFNLDIDPQIGRLDKRVEFELYSICLELVNNILKHSQATEAHLQLRLENERLLLTVTDNGKGIFDNASDGKGMKNIKARVESLGGKWNFENLTEGGVLSQITLPS
ncbi:tetratricopeptide repeat-containing sensor histidine kinase [Runella sp. SP2]|uniref:tetratricopeptide repeat-containing sensor histidine kinase n=1 Tax=Runella sp. SP2 TaxID=2268026 RepID=UPI0013DDD6B4|nr:tetratricopeptide repeat-containing sensor histidine kinase [Runella sp. SP2]